MKENAEDLPRALAPDAIAITYQRAQHGTRGVQGRASKGTADPLHKT